MWVDMGWHGHGPATASGLSACPRDRTVVLAINASADHTLIDSPEPWLYQDTNGYKWNKQSSDVRLKWQNWGKLPKSSGSTAAITASMAEAATIFAALRTCPGRSNREEWLHVAWYKYVQVQVGSIRKKYNAYCIITDHIWSYCLFFCGWLWMIAGRRHKSESQTLPVAKGFQQMVLTSLGGLVDICRNDSSKTMKEGRYKS